MIKTVLNPLTGNFDLLSLVTIASPANGLSINAQQELSIALASTSTTGALSNTDWNTFNNKQAAGNYITALTGDVTATGPGSVAATIANNAVSNAKFRQSAALSLVGNSSNATANVADITGTSNQVLRVASDGSSLGFGRVNLASTDAVTNQLTVANGGTGVASFNAYNLIAAGTTSTGALQQVATGTEGQVLVAGQGSSLPSFQNPPSTQNSILNYGAEVNTFGYATYADAAGASPVNGTGGSPTVTWTRTTSSPLIGTASFLFTKDAANRQGEGVSYDFSIDSAYQSQVLQISMNYAIASGTYSGGTPSTDSDLTVWIYDVTNALVIQPTSYKLSGAVQDFNYTLSTNFQAASNSTSYRLIIHVSTTSASAYTVKFDNIVVSPQQEISSTAIVAAQVTGDAASATSGNPIIFPTKVFDYTSSYSTSTGRFTCPVPGVYAVGGWLQSANATITFAIYKNAVSNSFIGTSDANGEITIYGTVQCNAGDLIDIRPNGTFNADSTSYCNFTLVTPIQAPGGDAARTVAMQASGNPASATSGNPIIFPTVNFDFTSSYNSTTGRYTCPLPGVYVTLGAVTSTNTGVGFNIYKNAIIGERVGTTDSAGEGTFAGMVQCVAGDIIDIRPDNTFDGVTTQYSVFRLSGSETILANQTVATQITGNPASATIGTVIIVPTKTFDLTNSYNTTTGRFTCPLPGVYAVGGWVSSATANVSISIYKNAVVSNFIGTTDSNGECSMYGLVQCNSGDLIDIRPNNTLDVADCVLNINRIN